MTAFGYDLGLIARDGGAGRMANVRKLMRLARDYEANEGRDLAGFLALAAESTRRDEREGMAAVQAEGHDGVRVMTVHAAKGLEFPVVAVPDLGRELNAGHQHADLVIGPPSDDGERRFGMRLVFPSAGSLGLWELVDLNTAESEAEAEEGCRLVYVAASRAQDRLILSGIYKPSDLEPAEEPKPNDTPLRRLLPALAERGFDGAEDARSSSRDRCRSTARPGCLDARLRIRISEPGAEASGRARALVSRRRPRTIRWRPRSEPPPLLDPSPGPVPIGHLSYSALSQYEGCGYRFYVERVLGAREALAVADDEAADEPPEPPTELVEPGVDRGPGARDRQRRPRRARVERAPRLGAARRRAARRAADARGPGGRREALGARPAPGRRLARLRAAPVARSGAGAGRGPVRARPRRDRRARADRPAGRAATACRPWSTTRPTRSTGGRAAELGERYEVQRQVYALAAGGDRGSSRGPRLPRGARRSGDRGVRRRSGWPPRASGWWRWSTGCASGEFEVTESPFPALCFGCPAAARLCPRPKWKPSLVTRVAVFGYASLVSPESAAQTLGRPVDAAIPARLEGWARGWTLGREQARSEKTFARPDGTQPRFCLGLNLDPDAGRSGPERRPDRAHRGGARPPRHARDPLPAGRRHRRDRRARRRRVRPRDRLRRPRPSTTTPPRPTTRSWSPPTRRRSRPPSTASARASSTSSARTTAPIPVELSDATLVADRIPPGNPRDW